MISDLAYAEIYFEDNPPPSILQIPGARSTSPSSSPRFQQDLFHAGLADRFLPSATAS